jgi:hypothetical protein
MEAHQRVEFTGVGLAGGVELGGGVEVKVGVKVLCLVLVISDNA